MRKLRWLDPLLGTSMLDEITLDVIDAIKAEGHANTLAWRKALKRADIENFRWHDLRHTCASWHRQAGTPTHELQRLGGWRSSVMVERYAHLAPDHLAQAANRLDSLLGGYDLATSEQQ